MPTLRTFRCGVVALALLSLAGGPGLRAADPVPGQLQTLVAGDSVEIKLKGTARRISVGRPGILRLFMPDQQTLKVTGQGGGRTDVIIDYDSGKIDSFPFQVQAVAPSVLNQLVEQLRENFKSVPGVKVTPVGQKIIVSGNTSPLYRPYYKQVIETFPDIIIGEVTFDPNLGPGGTVTGGHGERGLHLTSPQSADLLPVGQPATLKAAATGVQMSDGVTFEVNGAWVGTARKQPYEIRWRPTRGGDYRIRATGTGANGEKIVSDEVRVSVDAPEVSIISPANERKLRARIPMEVVVRARSAKGVQAVQLYATPFYTESVGAQITQSSTGGGGDSGGGGGDSGGGSGGGGSSSGGGGGGDSNIARMYGTPLNAMYGQDVGKRTLVAWLVQGEGDTWSATWAPPLPGNYQLQAVMIPYGEEEQSGGGSGSVSFSGSGGGGISASASGGSGGTKGGIESSTVNVTVEAEIIQIDAQIVEVDLLKALSLGMGWFSNGPWTISGNATLTSSDLANLNFGTGVNPNASGTLTLNNFVLTIEALEQVGAAKILVTPKLAVQSGSSASIFVGGQFPVQTSSTFTLNTTFQSFGTQLEIVPMVKPDGTIFISINTQISQIDRSVAAADGTPGLRIRQASSSATVQNGGMLAIGGLLSNDEEDNDNKVPLFGDIPVLGYLFKKREVQKRNIETVVMLRPTLPDVNPPHQLTSAEAVDTILPPTDKKEMKKLLEEAPGDLSPLPSYLRPQPEPQPETGGKPEAAGAVPSPQAPPTSPVNVDGVGPDDQSVIGPTRPPRSSDTLTFDEPLDLN